MYESFWNYIKGFEFIKDILLIVLGAFFAFLWKIIKTKTKVFWSKRAIKKSINVFNEEGIISLANAYPSYEASNMILDKSNDCFFLSFPDEYEDRYNCKDHDILLGFDSLTDLGKMMGIPNFAELVEQGRKKVAADFIASQNTGRELFNTEKYGIRNIYFTKTNDSNEDDIINVIFYLTDYFTHRVMRAVYHELLKASAPISKCTRVEDIQKYYPFLTSFGIDSLLILTSKNIESLVLMKRSKFMANMDKNRWHVTMNEGLSTADVDVVSDRVSFNQCVIRGYLEELGISYNNHIVNNEFRDIFMVKKDFELGITTIARVNLSYDDLLTCIKGAEDSSMETTGECRIINYNPSEIKKLIKTEKNDMTDVLRYCLQMCLSRML